MRDAAATVAMPGDQRDRPATPPARYGRERYRDPIWTGPAPTGPKAARTRSGLRESPRRRPREPSPGFRLGPRRLCRAARRGPEECWPIRRSPRHPDRWNRTSATRHDRDAQHETLRGPRRPHHRSVDGIAVGQRPNVLWTDNLAARRQSAPTASRPPTRSSPSARYAVLEAIRDAQTLSSARTRPR